MSFAVKKTMTSLFDPSLKNAARTGKFRLECAISCDKLLRLNYTGSSFQKMPTIQQMDTLEFKTCHHSGHGMYENEMIEIRKEVDGEV